MQDFLYRGIIRDPGIRFSYALCTGVANAAVAAHDCDPAAAHVLSRALTAAVLAAPLLDGEEKYTLRWDYNGVLRTVLVDVNSRGAVRGFVSPAAIVESAASSGDVYGSEGRVSVVKSTPLRTLNSGVVSAALLDVVEDLAYFFCISDQVETGITVLVGFNPDPAVPVRVCQGLMLQALPDCDPVAFDGFRNRMASEAFRDLLQDVPEVDNHFERVLAALYEGDAETTAYTVHACPVPRFSCSCTRENMVKVLRTLGNDELEAAVRDGESLTVTCRFCGSRHRIPPADIASLLGGKSPGKPESGN